MIKFSITKHAIMFPSKILAGHAGEHNLNLRLTADRDNGVVRGVGDWVAFDEYEEANAPAEFSGVIREQAADGNWYVEVVEPADAVVIYTPEVIAETYDERFKDMANFYNPEGKTVHAYVLHKKDIFELSDLGFEGKPAAGKTVTANATTGKLVVGA